MIREFVQQVAESTSVHLDGTTIFFVANALEADAPTRLLLHVAEGARRAGAQCRFMAWSRGGELAGEIAAKLETEPLVLSAAGAGPLAPFSMLSALLRQHNPSLVHVTLTRPSLLAPPVVRGSAATAKTVTTQHGVHEWCEGGAVPPTLIRWAFRGAARLCDRVVAVSHSVARDLMAARACTPDKLTVIHNGVDVDRFTPANRSARPAVVARLFPEVAPEAVFLVGAAGNLRRIKNYHVLVQAAALLRAHENMRFVLWGEGEERAALERDVQRLGLSSRFVLPGRAPSIAGCLAGCDCFVQPSQSESFGLAAAEAMASGVPVVASAVGGLTEIIEDGRSGLLVPAGDSRALARTIEYLATHPAVRLSLAAAARERIVAHFSLPDMVSQYLQMYAVLLQGGR